jgi:steroid 5-alpha reductase family enzyme
MSLRAFHLFFIALSVILAAFFGAWAVGQYRTLHEAVFIVAATGALVGAVGLAVYGTAFQRKTRNL